jgi:hypothetical protein
MDLTRRNYLAAAGGSLLAASALALPAEADEGNHGDADGLYGHGMVWNRDLPGVLGEIRLSFDLNLDLKASTGLGTANDPAFPDWGIHYAIDSVVQDKRPKGEVRFTMKGVVTAANNPANIGIPVAIIAETVGETTAIAIKIGDNAFGGAGKITRPIDLVLIIIVILIDSF